MKFLKIKFKNYRCFIDGEINFNENKDKNINLILGPNGGGKTEILFAFWWVLYKFDFSKLRGKEDTPYVLNSDIYKKLENSSVGASNSCSVILELEYKKKKYRVHKWCEYRKTEKKIMSYEYQEISYYTEKEELSLPVRDKDEINKILNRIIPESILNGIVFDGERMQKLSTYDENSQKAIKGVISDITNVELIENCYENYTSIFNDIARISRQLAKKGGNYDYDEIINKISEDSKFLKWKKGVLLQSKEKYQEIENELKNISLQLQDFNEARALEEKRKIERKNLEKEKNELEEYYKNLNATLKNGYLYICDGLFNDINNIITEYDVPQSLTVDAVKSILKRDRCICGCEFNQEMIEKLKSLISSLPPDNINSTLSESIRQLNIHAATTKENAKKDYNIINKAETNVKKIKESIASLSSQIILGNEDKAAELEKKNNKLHQDKAELQILIPELESEINRIEINIKDNNSLRNILSKSSKELKIYNSQMSFIDKCRNALDMIKEENKKKALKVINEELNSAYKLLSEDYDLGRRIYIIQFSEKQRYQMVVYLKANVEYTLNIWKENGKYYDLAKKGFTEEEINELAIIKCKDSNSTGQSKMNTLAFVKAILDYSNQKRDDEVFEVTKIYPLLIDAPFGDIFDKNLVKSSTELHSFTNQIILMLSHESYESVSNQLGKYVNNVYEFSKVEDRNYSIINCRNGGI